MKWKQTRVPQARMRGRGGIYTQAAPYLIPPPLTKVVLVSPPDISSEAPMNRDYAQDQRSSPEFSSPPPEAVSSPGSSDSDANAGVSSLVNLLVRLSQESAEVKRGVAHELRLQGLSSCPLCTCEYIFM
jgi:hypothetical protein